MLTAATVGLISGGVGAYIAFIRLQENFKSHVTSCNEKNSKLEKILDEFHDFLGDTREDTGKATELMQYLKDEMMRSRERLHRIEARVQRLSEKLGFKSGED